MRLAWGVLLSLAGLGSVTGSRAADWPVATRAGLLGALSSAVPGDRILLAPGDQYGRLFLTGLTGITITSQDPSDWAVLDAQGAGEVVHLTSARQVTLEKLVLRNFSDNGINIDDGGNWPEGKSEQITLRDLEIGNTTIPVGNHDGIKLSGVDQVLIDRVEISNWGTGGSGIDPVGVHHARIQNSILRHDQLTDGSGIRPKGGSQFIEVYGNLLVLNSGRALQAGGQTGPNFLRFLPGEEGFEADRVTFAGNLVVGGENSVSWVNIDGGTFAHNYLENPVRWVMRMQNENLDTGLVLTQNGRFADNLVVYNDGLRRISNHDGPGVLEETFQFAGNQWFDTSTGGPDGETELNLPAPELQGVYGVDPGIDAAGAVAFAMPWGTWVVNPHRESNPTEVADPNAFWLATSGLTSQFDPLASVPIARQWTIEAVASANPQVEAGSQAVFLRRADFPGLAPGAIDLVLGDADRDYEVGAADYARWAAQVGQTGTGLAADWNLSGEVAIGDYVLWAVNFGKHYPPPGVLAVCEPSSAMLVGSAAVGLAWFRLLRGGRRRSRPPAQR